MLCYFFLSLFFFPPHDWGFPVITGGKTRRVSQTERMVQALHVCLKFALCNGRAHFANLQMYFITVFSVHITSSGIQVMP